MTTEVNGWAGRCQTWFDPASHEKLGRLGLGGRTMSTFWLRPPSRKSSSSRPLAASRAPRRFRPVIERLEGRALLATGFELTGFPTSATAGVAATLTVRAVNADGSTDSMYWKPFHFTSTDPWASLPETSFLTNGIRTFTVMLSTVGTRSITATDNANSSITGSQSGIVVNPAATSQFLVDGWQAPARSGVPHDVRVTAVDAFGNVTPGYAGRVHFTSSDPRAVLPADSTLTNGTGTFTVTLRRRGTQTLTATDTVNNTITGNLATLPQLTEVFTQPPNPAGGYDKSAWYPPDGLDSDQYVWDRFIVGSNQAIGEVRWRGAYTNYLSGAGQSPVFDFTIDFYGSIAGGSQPDVTQRPLVRYRVGGNAGETLAGTFGGVLMYDYAFTLPTPFRAVAGTKYWVQIEASQGLTPIYRWPPDWSLAYGTGSHGAHFRHSEHGGYQSISRDIAFTMLTRTNQPGILVGPELEARPLVDALPLTAIVQPYDGLIPHRRSGLVVHNPDSVNTGRPGQADSSETLTDTIPPTRQLPGGMSTSYVAVRRPEPRHDFDSARWPNTTSVLSLEE